MWLPFQTDFYQSKNECGRTQEQVEDSLYMHMLFKNIEELNCNKNNFISEINDIYKLNVQNENEDIFPPRIFVVHVDMWLPFLTDCIYFRFESWNILQSVLCNSNSYISQKLIEQLALMFCLYLVSLSLHALQIFWGERYPHFHFVHSVCICHLWVRFIVLTMRRFMMAMFVSGFEFFFNIKSCQYSMFYTNCRWNFS
jgi:hypothetical protein